VRFAGIEEMYTVSDINGNTYIFDIFNEGNYRVSEAIIFKEYIEEVINERYIKKNS